METKKYFKTYAELLAYHYGRLTPSSKRRLDLFVAPPFNESTGQYSGFLGGFVGYVRETAKGFCIFQTFDSVEGYEEFTVDNFLNFKDQS